MIVDLEDQVWSVELENEYVKTEKEVIDLSKIPKLKTQTIKEVSELTLADMPKLDKISVQRPENTVDLDSSPECSIRSRNLNLSQPSPALSSKKRNLPWNPSENPLRNTTISPGIYPLPKLSEQDQFNDYILYLIQTSKKILKKAPLLKSTSEECSGLACEFCFSIEGTPMRITRNVQFAYFCTFEDLHKAICYMFGWSTQSEKFFVYMDSQKTQRVLGDPRNSQEEKTLAKSLYVMQEVHTDYTAVNYVKDPKDPWRVHIRLSKICDKDPFQKYPKCTAGKHMQPPEGMSFEKFQKVASAMNDPEDLQYEHYLIKYGDWVKKKFKKLSVDFPN